MLITRSLATGLGTLIPRAAGLGTLSAGPRKMAMRFAVMCTELTIEGLRVKVSPRTRDWLRASCPALVVVSRLAPSKTGGAAKSEMKYRPNTMFLELCDQSMRETPWFSSPVFKRERVTEPQGSLE